MISKKVSVVIRLIDMFSTQAINGAQIKGPYGLKAIAKENGLYTFCDISAGMHVFSIEAKQYKPEIKEIFVNHDFNHINSIPLMPSYGIEKRKGLLAPTADVFYTIYPNIFTLLEPAVKGDTSLKLATPKWLMPEGLCLTFDSTGIYKIARYQYEQDRHYLETAIKEKHLELGALGSIVFGTRTNEQGEFDVYMNPALALEDMMVYLPPKKKKALKDVLR